MCSLHTYSIVRTCASTFAAWFENKWHNSGILAWVLALGGFGGVLFFWYKPQPAGICIGMLALVAGIMTTRDMHIFEKMAWILVLSSLAYLEVRAIIRTTQDNTAKNQEILDGMTGGDSYLSFLPYPDSSAPPGSDKFVVQIFNSGKHTVWDARLEWGENEPTSTKGFLSGYKTNKAFLGSVSNTYGTNLEGVVLHPLRDKENTYTFRVFARNLPTVEQLTIFSKDSGGWEYSYKIWRYLPSPKIGAELLKQGEDLHFVQPMAIPLSIPAKPQ